MRIKWIIFILLFLLSCHTIVFASTEQTGVRFFNFVDKARNKTVSVQAWYPIADKTPAIPAKGIWKQANVAENAPVNLQVATNKNEKLPLIVLSHGYKGTPESLSWLALSLVKNGFIVVAAQHNDSGADAKPFMEHWQRAVDVSFVLKELQKTEFAKYIDFSRVGMAGYSVGTSTGLWLAGGIASTYERTVNPGRQFVPEEEFPEMDSEVADYLLKHTDFQAAKKSYREPLIKSVFLIAPGYGWAFGAKQLGNIQIPIFIVAAENDEMLYPQTNAFYFSKYLPHSFMKIIPDVGHFVFINQTVDPKLKPLTPDEKIHLDVITHLGRFQYTPKERDDVQRLVGRLAVEFFGGTLSTTFAGNADNR